ncbi:putative ribosomal protein L18 [Lupinus albus]|uniref:Putative ribosomal protein L18 n=1 Tax=Lupinus albus TaxID=3870 RepID=A0A6A4PY40_LUPAL|nr:putative ribosomal protein L18 [Lupinus albus]
MLSRHIVSLASLCNKKLLFRAFNFCFINSLATNQVKDCDVDDDALHSASKVPSTLHLSPFFSDPNYSSTARYDIQLVDCDAWGISSGLAQAWLRGRRDGPALPKLIDDEFLHCHHVETELDFEEDIDNMRVRGNLLYKLERSSKEFEEYSLEFHGKKSSKKENLKEVKKAKTSSNVTSKMEKKLLRVQGRASLQSDSHKFDDLVQHEPLGGSNQQFMSATEVNPDSKVRQVTRSTHVIPKLHEINGIPAENKRQRIPTFNQLTGPYHEPFCLDIYISNASVRACIIHRVTSKVVAVAHSISKDIKFDMASTKNRTTCAAVGAILAQRALADDIHDVTYTPRKGERLEGKLQIVLQSIINNGINVKVKIKQRPKKSFRHI